MGLIQREVQKVYMWKEPYTDYSAMRGPCPEGFHVPENSEVVNLRSILVDTLGVATGSIGTYLRLPLQGVRSYSDASISFSGTTGYYLTSSSSSTYGYMFQVNAYDMIISQATPRGNGCCIRAFKDVPVTPTTAWTKIFGTSIATGGIYWSSTLGLISISGDGTTRITIQDKNLGAASVNGSGYYFQWGNNYGFASSGGVTKSSTRVSTTGYGPGNYYNSSTFITTSSSPYDRSSVQNDNLWGGVTGVVSGGGDIQIRPEEWKPSSDVIAYFPLDSKYQLNSYDGSKVLNANNSSYSFSNNCIEFTNSCILNYQSTTTTNTYTVFGYMYGGSAGRYGMSSTNSLSASSFNGRWLYRNGDTDLSINKENGSSSSSTGYTITAGWHCIVMVCSSSKEKVYVDGVLLGESSLGQSSTQPYLIINSVISGYKVGKVGLSNSEWTAEQVADFYNKTKSDFGL